MTKSNSLKSAQTTGWTILLLTAIALAAHQANASEDTQVLDEVFSATAKHPNERAIDRVLPVKLPAEKPAKAKKPDAPAAQNPKEGATTNTAANPADKDKEKEGASSGPNPPADKTNKDSKPKGESIFGKLGNLFQMPFGWFKDPKNMAAVGAGAVIGTVYGVPLVVGALGGFFAALLRTFLDIIRA